MKKLIAGIMILVLCLMNAGCQKPEQKDIQAISVEHFYGASGLRDRYDINIAKKTLVEHIDDASTRNIDLQDNKIAAFLQDCERYKFAEWKGNYQPTGDITVLDGHQWKIIITFSDSTKKTIEGSNAYPETWDDMYTAFENLTGKNILEVKSRKI